MKYTLYELFGEYTILIPQIQRDYAQGRKGQLALRKSFLLQIKKALEESSQLNLDFVYGYTLSISNGQVAFVPLDGQQRLTTLWLLHWFLAPRVLMVDNGRNLLHLPNETKEWLCRFTYETRNSSKRFCAELVKQGLPDNENPISDTIKDAPWFMATWKKDPTVVAMLNMLDSIQSLDFNEKLCWENLIKKSRITFDYINIKSEEFKLTDELYIKMNSRGKPLTTFENFKAHFSEILSSNDTEYVHDTIFYNGSSISYQQYFSFNIDSVWMDLFWKLSNIYGIYEFKVDECLMNYFSYVAQMCYFKSNLDKTADDFKCDFSIFKKKEDVLFLFDSLNWLYALSSDIKDFDKDNIKSFFDELFLDVNDLNNEFNRIRLFDDTNVEIYLFLRCLLYGLGMDNRNKIILFCLLSFVLKFNIKSSSDNLKSFIRVIRNLLQATRQRKDTVYNTNVRINSFGRYWKLINQLMREENVYKCLIGDLSIKDTDISPKAIENEINKAKIILESDNEINFALYSLEEIHSIGGLIHQFQPQKYKANLVQYKSLIGELLSNKDYEPLIIGGLIASGFAGFYTKNCRLGKMRFFGKENKWNTILTSDDSDISNSLIKFFGNFESDDPNDVPKKMQAIIDDYLKEQSYKSWQYYFLQYPEILARSNYFAWKNDFCLRILGSYGSNPLLAYHINPYVYIISNKLDDAICEEKDCYSQYSNESGLVLKNGISMICNENGFQIELPKGYILNESIREEFGIGEDMLLKMDGNVDRIQVAINLCKKL